MFWGGWGGQSVNNQWLTGSWKFSIHIGIGNKVLGLYKVGSWNKSLFTMVFSLNWSRKTCLLVQWDHKQTNFSSLALNGLGVGKTCKNWSLLVLETNFLIWKSICQKQYKTWFWTRNFPRIPGRSKSTLEEFIIQQTT